MLHLRNVDTHWSFPRYIPRMQLCHLVIHNRSPLSPAARSNPLRCIRFAWVGITRPPCSPAHHALGDPGSTEFMCDASHVRGPLLHSDNSATEIRSYSASMLILWGRSFGGCVHPELEANLHGPASFVVG